MPNLLWTNETTTASFSAQVIRVDLTNYDAILVEFLTDPTNNLQLVRTVSMITLKNTGGFVNYSLFVNNAFFHYHRDYFVFGDRVDFHSGYLNATINDSKAIPYKIYGVNLSPIVLS